eukprot:6197304-Pleurochrysis_carterae.AAC.1
MSDRYDFGSEYSKKMVRSAEPSAVSAADGITEPETRSSTRKEIPLRYTIIAQREMERDSSLCVCLLALGSDWLPGQRLPQQQRPPPLHCAATR